MLHLFLRSRFRLLIGLERSCPTGPRLLHDALPETPTPLVSDSTVSYLVESCGLSPAAALAVAQRFTIKATDRADCFLSLLRAHGFSPTQIAHVVTSCPLLLNSDQENAIIPKFDFFINAGYSSSDLVKVISVHPRILCCNLENKLSPNFHKLSAILGSDRKAIIATVEAPRILGVNLDRIVLPNMKTLLEIGVPQCNIVKFAVWYPRGLLRSPSRFNNAIGWLKQIGYDSSKSNYIEGLHSVSRLSPTTWENKLEIYRGLGWSEETILSAFRKYPRCMAFSEGKILKNISFYLEEIKCDPSYIWARPFLLYYSFEKRIGPRYRVFCLLKSNNLADLDMNFIPLLFLTTKDFIDKFVTKYAGQVPDLRKVYDNSD